MKVIVDLTTTLLRFLPFMNLENVAAYCSPTVPQQLIVGIEASLQETQDA